MDYKDFTEFQTIVCKKRGPKKMMVTNSLGIRDIYKRIRKNHWYNIGRPLKEHEFYSIIRQVNDLLAENISDGITVKFPAGMGKLVLIKRKTGAQLINDKLVVTYPVDWARTMKLWYEDEGAMKDKVLVRNEEGIVYKILYDKYNALYDNKIFYQFVLNRFIKRALKKKISNGETDTIYGK